MNRNTIRLVIVLAVISIIGISIIQVYWFKQAFDLEEDQFNRDVTSSLHNVANSFFEINKSAPPDNNPIRQLSSGYYVVMINNKIDANLLEYLLRTEFEKRNITIDFEYGIYDCTSDEMVYGNYVSLSNANNPAPTELPKWQDQPYYFGVNFPGKTKGMINRLDIWFFSSGVLLVVIVFFSYSLFIILRQKRLSEVQKDFINNMTHELKTPISTIALSAETLKEPGIISDPQRLWKYADLIEKENNRMKNQVEQVLQIAAMDNSELELKLEDINIHSMLQSATETMQPVFETEEASVQWALNAQNDLITGDRLHLSSVFYNLLENAVKYCKKVPEIIISTEDLNNRILITVKDNGIGMSREHLKRVFGRFYRVPTGNVHDVKGFGLGLNYVKLVVKAHRGMVSAESIPDAGSTFKIELPLK